MANENIRDGVRRKMVEQMAAAVKDAAAKCLWQEPPVSMDSDDAGRLAKSAVESAYATMLGPGVPMWFSRAVNAAKRVLLEDELLGLDCVAALLASAERANADQRPAALELLWLIVDSPAGTGSFLGCAL